jgi:DNA-binding LacI/PurR family transcriptional regulator
MATTIKTIANHFGVSLSTASRALNDSGYVRQELRQVIKAYAKANKWYASSAAVSMAKGKTKTVAFVINKISNDINSVLLEQVVLNLRDKGFHVFVSQFTSPEEQEKELESYLYRRPDAVFVFPLALSAEVDDILDQLLEQGTQVVAMGVRQSEHCAAVCFDFHAQGFTMMTHLLQHGHRRIAFLGDFGGEPSDELMKTVEGNRILSIKRLAGSLDACKRANESFDLKRDVIDGHHGETALKRALLSHNHSAFICATTSLLCTVYRLCTELGVKIGDELSVIGLGANPLFDGFSPRPVCLDPQAAQLGKTVARLITDASLGNDKLTIPPVIVPGSSVKKLA